MAKITKIAHVNTYNPSTGAVNCHQHTNDLDFWATGTIVTSGTGFGTCNPGAKHFDIILIDTTDVTSDAKLYIEYENAGTTTTKTVTKITVRPPLAQAGE